MERTSQLDGSDTQGNHASTQAQRLAAFKRQLGEAVLIFDSLDPSSVEQLKEDEGCKDLVQRLLPIVPTTPVPNAATQGDAWKAFKSGIVSTVACFSQPPAPSLPEPDVDALKKEVTIHFLKGCSKRTDPEDLYSINQLLGDAEGYGKYTVVQSNRVYTNAVTYFCLCLTSSPATDSLPSMIQNLRLSHLWKDDAIARIREGGTVEYGLRIMLDAKTDTLFDLDPHLAQNGRRIYSDYLQSTYLDSERSDDDIYVSETMVAGMYVLSGNTVRLERLVADGEKSMEMRVQRAVPGGVQSTDVYQTILRPFRLQY